MEKFEVKNMLYKISLKSRALSVILYLIDRANKDLVCFPSIKTISSDLNISVSTTKRALNNLVEIGFIEKIERFLDTTGKQTSNLYVLNLENIKNYENLEKVEKVTEQEDKEILEIFEQKQDTEIKDDVVTNAIKEDIAENTITNILKENVVDDIKIKERENDKEPKYTNEHKNVDKKISIFGMLLQITNSNAFVNSKNIKKTMLCKFKKLEKIKYTLKDYISHISELHPSSFLPYL